MKVLQINAVSVIKSTGRICSEISDYLNDTNEEGYIGYSYGLPYKNSFKVGTSLEIKMHALYSRFFGLQAYYSKKGTKKLLDFISDLKPDVVHLHNLHANYINLRMLLHFLAKEDIPTVLTLHDCWFYTGKCTHYTVSNCNRWETGCGNCPRLKKDNPSWFFDRTKKMHKDKREWFSMIPRLGVVGVSDWITFEASKSFLSSAQFVKRIYNWINTDEFKPVNTDRIKHELGLDNKFIILGVASGWSNNKGIEKFVELASMIEEDTAIVLVGKLNEKTSLPKNIIHKDETHNINELVEYYSIADVFVNLSLEESFGKVTAEALACGTPIVVMNSTANPELVGNGCGYVIENNDMECILDTIHKVKKNGKIKYASNCIEYAKMNFDKNARIADYLSVYKELIK
ncbi:glycosyltransferase [Paenibacillus sp. BAC0078]